MSRLASMAGGFSASLLTGEIRSLMSGLRFNVVMPAGQVFGFSGLDTTSDGVFYTYISYATPQGGSHIQLQHNLQDSWLLGQNLSIFPTTITFYYLHKDLTFRA